MIIHFLWTSSLCCRLDKLILEAISNLKEPNGSDRASIASYIEDQYWAPANLRKLLATKLKFLSANGTLIKAKHKYRITPNTPVSVPKRSPKLLLEGRQKGSPKAQKKEINILTKSLVDADLSRMRGMTAQEAAAAAAQAIAEAEVAIAEAEEAAREAERAEAEAEAAQVFAKAAIKALKCRALHTCPVDNAMLPNFNPVLAYLFHTCADDLEIEQRICREFLLPSIIFEHAAISTSAMSIIMLRASCKS
ncbi:Telomere repeat-binding factor 2 [Citrus sinensis]|uniref:Telomere repeat-binding factor 2 n=1 Tax=Citrus sinensis TaxID=2711 RepID=A0ACB8J3Q6_CITSI|nr:Telomere repeat-binding factor 2 [Citrus sinensis]KAH9712351.1 Telomere repeat-binding factor 2 [Citrus sinensis]